jgi:FkbM family methyltransferase
MTRVSVVIPCLNASPWIGATLESVFNQDLNEVETIVVDDGSVDGSAELVEREFPSVRVARGEHGGPSRARNLGTRLASGQFIQYLDADDLLAPGKLARQLEALETSGADVAYGDWCELRSTPEGRFEPARTVSRHIDGDPQVALFTDFWCPPAAYLFRREIVQRVNAWNEALPIIQDARFVLDCALEGARFVYCPGVAALYRQHASGSVSTRDPLGFTRDCLTNALQVEAIWTSGGHLSSARRAALVRVYEQVARNTCAEAPELFDVALAALERLQPGYRPSRPRYLALASRALGYRRAEGLTVRVRAARRTFRGRGLVARRTTRLVCAIPGVRPSLRRGLRFVVRQPGVDWQRRQQLHNLLAEEVAPTGLATTTVSVPGAKPLRISLNVRDDHTRYWYFWGYAHYERATVALLRQLLRIKHTFVDAGANVGYYSLFAAQYLECRGRVHAFEPRRDCYLQLADNAQRNRLDGLTVNRVALSDEDGEARLFIPEDGGWTNASLLADFAGSDRFEVVPAMRLDTYCAMRDISNVDLLKIDVEGAELRVLRGMGRLLDMWRPDIILEVLEPYADELEAFFASSPYRKFRIRENGLEEIERISAEPHDRNVYLSCQPPAQLVRR